MRTRHRSPRDGAPGVTFSFAEASLTVVIGDLRKVSWVYATGDKRSQYGSGIMWLNGRLTAAAEEQVENENAAEAETEEAEKKPRLPDARRFFSIMTELGLSFGDIEAELRDLTRYQEGDL